jgi:transportin-3
MGIGTHICLLTATLVIEDFFRLSMDVILYHTSGAIISPLMSHILNAACTTLTLLKTEVLMTTLHFLRDFIGYGSPDLPSSSFGDDRQLTNPPEIQSAVKQILLHQGEALTQRVMTGMMYSFPEDCIPDASGVVLDMLTVLPQQTALWIRATLEQLPAGAIRPQEKEKLAAGIEQ